MKFEKFLKETGTHGQIFNCPCGEKWLVCGGVGMVIPVGAENFFGSNEVSEKVATVVSGLIDADVDDKVSLTRAIVSADGKAKDIVRVFGDGLDIEIGIYNADFGLLEKSDVNLAEVEIEDSGDERLDGKYLVVLDNNDNAIGFIRGVNEI